MDGIGILLYIYALYTLCLVPVYSLNVDFKQHVITTSGMSLPVKVNAILDSQVNMRLTNFFPHQEKCTIRASNGDTYDLLAGSLPHRFEKMDDDGCGFRLKNISAEDDGRWKLSSSLAGEIISGYTDIQVVSITLPSNQETHMLVEGANYLGFNLYDTPTDYCVVKRPLDADVTIVQGSCQMDIQQAKKTMQGEWEIRAGVPGNLEEIPAIYKVNVQSGHLDTGFLYEEDSKKLHIYCNLAHMVHNITFCRFQRQTDGKSFHLSDGLSNGLHSYYGNGLLHKECGITVEQATDADLVSWRCTLGLSFFNIVSEITSFSITENIVRINANGISTHSASRNVAALRADNGGEQSVTSARLESLELRCKVHASLSYCWFKHPNGTQLSQIRNSEDAPYRIVTDELNIGTCALIFKNADYGDTGRWECHMGTTSLGLEDIQVVNVRISGPLAAETNEIKKDLGDEVDIACITAAGLKNLKHCRFLSPSGIGFSIDDTINKTSAIKNKYYFKEGAKMYQGECSITISSIEKDDIGEWICAAEIEGTAQEFTDRIRIVQITTRSIASTIGIAVGVVFAVAIVAAGGFTTWQRRRKNRSPAPRQIGEQNVQGEENIEMTDAERPRVSTGSSTSSSKLFSIVSEEPKQIIVMEAGTSSSTL